MAAFDPDVLKTFVLVAEDGSFTKAAQKQNLTQSATSHQMKKLEAEVGRDLFVRKARSVLLTSSGRHFLLYARKILALQDEARQTLQDMETSPLVRLGLTDLYSQRFIPAIAEKMRQALPQVKLDVYCAPSWELKDRANAGDLDVAVMIRHDKDPFGSLVGMETLAWTCHPNFAFATTGKVPLVMFPPGCVYRQTGLQALTDADRQWEVIYTSQSALSIQAAVEAGLGITIRTVGSIPKHWRHLTVADGFPELEQPAVDIYVNPTTGQPAPRLIADLLQTAIKTELADLSTKQMPH